MRLTFERLSGGCNLHRCKLCGKVDSDSDKFRCIRMNQNVTVKMIASFNFQVVTHIRNHYHVHFPGRFECPLCHATYTRSDNLRTHCKFKHPMYNPDARKLESPMGTSGSANDSRKLENIMATSIASHTAYAVATNVFNAAQRQSGSECE